MSYVCDKCGQLFTRSYSLLRHQRESCLSRFENIHGGKRQRVDGAASTSTMQNCATCNVNVPQNQMFAHQRSLQHKSKSCVTVSRGVELIQSAFKNRMATYRVSSDNDHVDYSIFFAEIKSKVLGVINNILRLQHTLKINMVAVGQYFLPSQETISEKSFNTANEIVTVGSDLDDVYQAFVEAMKVQSSEFQEKDSGTFKN